MNYKLDDLEIYNLAEIISDKIWNIVINWEYLAKDTIGKQLCRAADSISANIAEGYGRFHYKENKNFCYYSRGSILEVKSFLRKSKNRNLIQKKFTLNFMPNYKPSTLNLMPTSSILEKI